jgi:hypothetical protein
MSTNDQLEGFLASEAQAATPEPAPSRPSEAPQAAPEPKQDTKAPAEPKAATATPEPDDDEPPQPLDGEPLIGRRAYENERRRRQDWKEKASRAEGELAAVKRHWKRPRAAHGSHRLSSRNTWRRSTRWPTRKGFCSGCRTSC